VGPEGPGDINGLAVDRTGRLYVAYALDEVFPVDTITTGFRCEMPGFGGAAFNSEGGNISFQPIGIAFVGQPNGSEALYGSFVVVNPPGAMMVPGSTMIPSATVIGTIDVYSGAANVADWNAEAPGGNMTGTVDGRLFVSIGSIVEVDPKTGRQLQDFSISTASLYSMGIYGVYGSFPLAAWAGDFFVFPTMTPPATPNPSSTAVVRFRPDDNSVSYVTQLQGQVVGAAVSSCAPKL
jgi:hypothetical protein